MADIELVIKIPEEMYQNVLNGTYCGTLYEELKNGTPLPKGHGRLINESEVIKSLFDFTNCKKSIGMCIDNVPTIIEADKETAE